MKYPLFLFFIVSLASGENGWRSGRQYNYSFTSRTVSGINQVMDIYAGVLVRADLTIQANSEIFLSVRVNKAEYAEINSNLSGGWDAYINNEFLNYSTFPLHDKPFELFIDNGVIREMTVDKMVPSWEVNFFKAVAGLLQLDTRASNIEMSEPNLIPKSKTETGYYKTMEDSIHGIYETAYDISFLPEYILQSKPELVPLPRFITDGKIFQIKKDKNFSKGKEKLVYYFGTNGQSNWEAGSNQMGNFLSRSSSSQIIITGDLKRYTVQSSVTDEKITIAPNLYNKQKGTVGSRTNLTIVSVGTIVEPFPIVINRRSLKNLVFEFEWTDKHEISNELYDLKNLKKKDSSFMSVGRESTDKLLKSNLTRPNQFMYYTSESSETSTESVIRLCREIGYGITHPKILSTEKTLSKFNTLVRLLRTFSADKLKEVTKKIYVSYQGILKYKVSSKANLNYKSWVTFRDGVAQSGTGDALVVIRDWINKSNMVTVEEASLLVASLPKSARHPTIEYLDYFFEMLVDANIKEKASLKISATLSFTELLRKTIIERTTHQDYYYYYALDYIAYFEKQFKDAITVSSSTDIQLYIRALNNIAHPKILKIFKPYLEKKTGLSNFQRFYIIASMDKIVKIYPETSRRQLFKIYQDMAETTEIRVASIMQLFKTNPSLQMMQKIAQQTKYELNKQVRAAVKSAIESIASQSNNVFTREMVEKARSAVNMLTPENFGMQYSRNFIKSYIVEGQNLAYKHHLSYIQSEDSFFPSSMFYYFWRNIGGYKSDLIEAQFTTSSMTGVLNKFYVNLIETGRLDSVEKTHKSGQEWTIEQIMLMLKFDRKKEEKIEGNLLFPMFDGKKFFPFDDKNLDSLNFDLLNKAVSLMSGENRNYTKLYNEYSMEISFPTAMGFIFSFSLESPTLINIDLKPKLFVQPYDWDASFINKDYLKLDITSDLSYNKIKEGTLGFIMPYNGKMYSASLEKNFQVNIPVKSEIQLYPKIMKIVALFKPNQFLEEEKLFEYTTLAFTSISNLNRTKPLVSSESIEYIQSFPHKTIQHTAGLEKTGFVFNLKLDTDRKNLNFIEKNLKGHDLLSLLSYFDSIDEINFMNSTITFDPKRSSSNQALLSLVLQNIDNASDTKSNKDGTNKKLSYLSPESKHFYEKSIVKLLNPQSQFVKMNLKFLGKRHIEHDLSFGYINSFLSNVTHHFFHYSNDSVNLENPQAYKISLQATSLMPDVSSLSYKEVLDNESVSKINVTIDFGPTANKSHVLLNGELTSSQRRKNYLRQHPLTKLCEKYFQEGYKFHSSCRNITRRVNYLDNYRFDIKYDNIPDDTENFVYQAYRFMYDLFFYEYNTEITRSNLTSENLLIDVSFGKNLLSSNFSVNTSTFSEMFKDVYIHEWIRPLVVVHPQYNMMERLGYKILNAQSSPVCTFEKDLIFTFDNSSYSVNLENKLYVLVHLIPEPYKFYHEYFSVILRQLPTKYLELLILVGDNSLHISQGNNLLETKLTYNGQLMASRPKYRNLLRGHDGSVVLSLHMTNKGATNIKAVKHNFEVTYHGTHIIIQVSNKLRGQLRGLCGNFDGEQYNEFTTPQNTIMTDARQFISYYSLLNRTMGVL